MRVWIDPGRAAALDLTAGEIVAALRAQNVQVAAGTLGQPPYAQGNAFQLNVETQGRLTDPRQFADVVIRIPRTSTLLSPLLAVVPLQVFACELATAKGLDVDQPRNLAKSVTVE